MQAITGEVYDFQAKPKPVRAKAKYRDQVQEDEDLDGSLRTYHLQFDKRIVRGNTYAAISITSNQDPDIIKKQEIVKRSKPPKIKIQKDQQVSKEQYKAMDKVPTPEPVFGRKHKEQQTEDYKEVLTDKLPEHDQEIQTDFYIDRPVTRLFVPKKLGIDQETQIYDRDPDLFDFDVEAEPILSVLITKTLEQSRFQVLEEEEMRIIKEQKKQYEQKTNAEKAEMQRLEAHEKRQYQEIERRKKQHLTQKNQNLFLHKKLVSREISKHILHKLKPNSYQILTDQGFFRRPLQTELLDNFLPWVYDQIQCLQDEQVNNQKGLDGFSYLNQQENKHEHQAALDLRVLKKQQKIENEEQQRLDRIERKRQRAIEKQRQQEMQRREELKEKIEQKIIKYGEVQPNILHSVLCDLDGSEENEKFVGMFGGVVTQIMLFLNILENKTKNLLSQAPKSQEFFQQEEKKKEFLKQLFDQLFVENTMVALHVFESIDEVLKSYFEGLGQDQVTLENVFSIADPQQQAELIECIVSHFNSFGYNQLQQLPNNHGEQLFPPENNLFIIAEMLSYVFNHDKAKLQIKFIRDQIPAHLIEENQNQEVNESQLQESQQQAQQLQPQPLEQKALVIIRPIIDVSYEKDQQAAEIQKESKQKQQVQQSTIPEQRRDSQQSGRTKKTDKQTEQSQIQQTTQQQDDEQLSQHSLVKSHEDEQEEMQSQMQETEQNQFINIIHYDQKSTLLPIWQEVQILTQHSVAEVNLRRIMMKLFLTLVGGIEKTKEFEILKIINYYADTYQHMALDELLESQNIPQFDFDIA